MSLSLNHVIDIIFDCPFHKTNKESSILHISTGFTLPSVKITIFSRRDYHSAKSAWKDYEWYDIFSWPWNEIRRELDVTIFFHWTRTKLFIVSTDIRVYQSWASVSWQIKFIIISQNYVSNNYGSFGFGFVLHFCIFGILRTVTKYPNINS